MSENEVLKKQKTGFYRDIELKPVQTGVSDIKKKYDQLEGIVPTADIQTNFNILEMHVDLNIEEFLVHLDDGEIEMANTLRKPVSPVKRSLPIAVATPATAIICLREAFTLFGASGRPRLSFALSNQRLTRRSPATLGNMSSYLLIKRAINCKSASSNSQSKGCWL